MRIRDFPALDDRATHELKRAIVPNFGLGRVDATPLKPVPGAPVNGLVSAASVSGGGIVDGASVLKGLLPRVTLGILWLMLGHTR